MTPPLEITVLFESFSGAVGVRFEEAGRIIECIESREGPWYEKDTKTSRIERASIARVEQLRRELPVGSVRGCSFSTIDQIRKGTNWQYRFMSSRELFRVEKEIDEYEQRYAEEHDLLPNFYGV